MNLPVTAEMEVMGMKEYLLEACVDSVESAVIATESGAGRLELCSNLIIGGTTPTLALFEEIRKRCSNKINVLIRPRFGDFCYSEAEYAIVKREISQFERAGADGVVIGMLEPDGSLGLDRMGECMELAGKMKVTLHRAFDVCRDPYEALEQAVKLGVHTILTSGQEDGALKGAACLAKLKEQAGGRIAILAGSGVGPETIGEIYQKTGITQYHMSGKRVLQSLMTYRKGNVHMGMESISEFEVWQTDGAKIAKAVSVLEELV